MRAPEILRPGVRVRHALQKGKKRFLERFLSRAAQRIAHGGGALPGQKACQPRRALQAVGPESAGAVAAKDRVVKIVYVHGGAPLQADDLGVEKDLQRRDLDEQRQNEYGGQYDHVHQQPFLPVKLLRLLHGGILFEGKMKVKTE